MTVPPRRRLVAALAVVAAVVLAVDQATKALALAHLTEGVRTPLLGHLLALQLIGNPGAALSLASGMTWIFTIAAVGVSVVIVRVADRLGSRAWAVALGLLLGGAVGNLVDRLVRPPGFGTGHVVDFLAYGDWFIGNVADIAIVVSAVMIVLLTLIGVGIDGRRSADAATVSEESAPRDGSAVEAGSHEPGGGAGPNDGSVTEPPDTQR
ncbi:signal peptidase II [Isoptericola sp. b441]|uniref:Lipoprotein signal peptidase n=1 Tax=Actinotalea lenta TaxID=3064654 RepID=A0ABT9DAB0_9CELL|nr:signal peptidase II [Isoptericola sp. b441]MDO8107436.1 signal peptidase II [Isoptericola sp. b441]